MAQFREAIRIDPDLALAHSNLGAALQHKAYAARPFASSPDRR